MNKYFQHLLKSVSFLPAVLILPVMAEDLDIYQRINGEFTDVNWSITGTNNGHPSNENPSYYSYLDGGKRSMFAVITNGDTQLNGNVTDIRGFYPYNSFASPKTNRFVTFGVDGADTATFSAKDTNLLASGDGVVGQWGMAMEVGNRTDKTKTATALFNGSGDVNLATFWKNYTAQTLTVRSNGVADFKNDGNLVIDAKGIYGATGVTQQGTMSVDIDGDLVINAGYAQDAESGYDVSQKMTTTNAVPLQVQGAGATTFIAKNVTLNSFGQGYSYTPNTSYSDGSIGLELSYGDMIVKSDKFNVNAISTAEVDTNHRDSYGILFEDPDDAASLTVDAITNVDVVTKGNAYGVVVTADGDNVLFKKALNITTNADGVSSAMYVQAGTVTTNGVNVVARSSDGKASGIQIDNGAVWNMNGTTNVKVLGNDESVNIVNNGIINVKTDSNVLSNVDGNGTLNIENSAVLNIGKNNLTQNKIILDGELLATLRKGDVAQITANTFDGNGVLNLTMKEAGTYKVFGNAKFNNTTWDESGITATSPIYHLSWDSGDVTATLKTVDEIAKDNMVSKETAATVSNFSESSSDQLKRLSVKIQHKLAESTPQSKAAVENVTKAVHPEKESVVQSVSTSVQNTVTNLAASRMMTMGVGRNGGEGLYNKSKKDDAFNGYTRGIAVGMDGTLERMWTIGLGYSFAHSDVNGSARVTDIDSNTLFVYGQYKPTQWYMNAILNYTWSNYSENSDALGTPVRADYDVDSFGGAIATGYEFKNGITPEIGLRYMHIDVDDYTNSLGIKASTKDSDYMTAMVGTKYGFDIKSGKNTSFTPQLNVAVKYDLLSDGSVSTVTIPGIDSYVLDGGSLNRLSGECGIGLGMKHRGLNISVNYDVDVRKDYLSQTGMLKFKYNF